MNNLVSIVLVAAVVVTIGAVWWYVYHTSGIVILAH